MDNRSHFRSLDELIRGLDRERALLKEMFAKRKTYSFRYDIARELAAKKEESLEFLRRNGVIRDNGEFVELFQDVEIPFTSPSFAGSFCTGAACQGTEAWVDKDGKKYPTEWWQEEK